MDAGSNAKARKVKLKSQSIQKIRCARFDDEKIIYIWVTDSRDPDGVAVTATESGLQTNIAPWLFAEGIAPAPGLKQKFDLLESPEQMLGLPALCFNMEKTRKTTHFNPSGKKDDDAE